MTSLVLGPGGRRMYAGSVAGLWRSDDVGESWLQLTWPQPSGAMIADIPGALYAPRVFDVAVSPFDPNLVLVCALDSQFVDNRDGIYRSADGGATWTLVLKSLSTPNATTFNIVFAPDDPRFVIAVGTNQLGGSSGIVALSHDAGATWSTQSVGRSLWHVAIAPLESNGQRRVYAAGDGVLWYSTDAGQTWRTDGGVAAILAVRTRLDTFQKSCDPKAGVGGFAGSIATNSGDAPQILAVEPGNPGVVYLATTGGANGPTYYSDKVADSTPVNADCRRLAGEASLWRGDFSGFETAQSALWTPLPGPPVYTGSTTPSGNCYVSTKATSSGFLVFFSDNSHVHVSVGVPASRSWHRLDGKDASEAKRAGQNSNVLFVHADPHAIAFTPDFEITLKAPIGVPARYTLNRELDRHVAGRLWMANDGGVWWCDDGGKQESSWQIPSGIETLDAINVAGLAGLGNTPALYMGCGDNNDFYTRDGGAHWGDPGSNCGDCDAWFADPADARWVLQFLPRRGPGQLGIITGDGSSYPDAGDGGAKTFVPTTKVLNSTQDGLTNYASSGFYLQGYRPLIRTIATELPLADGDVVIIEQALDGTAFVLRTTAIRAITTLDDWHDAGKAQRIGPPLPAGAIVVQAAGGHANTSFFVGDSRLGRVWRLAADHTQWNQIVPQAAVGSAPVRSALQWFVDPYDANVLYVLDADGMKISVDGGQSWIFDTAMTTALRGGDKLKISPSLLQDMQFSRGERQTRFAMGTAGVLGTTDFGIFWFPVLNSVALPGRPESGFFDPLSDLLDRSFYVECEGRGILRVSGLPLSVSPTGAPLDMMQLAALDH